jgi:ubiquinone/menaquinone biosynthesis C-methylase UbiE
LVYKDLFRIWLTVKEVLKLSGKSIIDVGCGDGDFLKVLLNKGDFEKVVCSDLSTRRIKNTLKKFKNHKLKFKSANITCLPFSKKEFDIVTCLQVLEHLKDYKKAICELARISNNYLVVSVPNKEKITQETCLHCGKTTPHFGHINSFGLNDIKNAIKKEFAITEKRYFYSKTFRYFKILEKLPFPLFFPIDKLFCFLFKNPTWMLLISKRK